MDSTMTLVGPSMRAERALGARAGHGADLTRVNSYADVWATHEPAVTQPISGPRPRPVSILDPQAASAPPRWSP